MSVSEKLSRGKLEFNDLVELRSLAQSDGNCELANKLDWLMQAHDEARNNGSQDPVERVVTEALEEIIPQCDNGDIKAYALAYGAIAKALRFPDTDGISPTAIGSSLVCRIIGVTDVG